MKFVYMDETQIFDEVMNKKQCGLSFGNHMDDDQFIHKYHFIHIVKSIHIVNCIHVVKFIHVVSPSCIHLFPFMTSDNGQYTHFSKNTHENCFCAILKLNSFIHSNLKDDKTTLFMGMC